MNKKEFAERRKELLQQINKLAMPVDPNKKQRDKLLDELDRLDQEDMNRIDTAIKDTRKLLKKEITELKRMCRGTFAGTLVVKAKVRVRLNVAPCSLDTYDSTCGVKIEFPKDSRNLALFTLDDDEELSSANIHIATHAKGLLPDLDKHIDRLTKLHADIIKKLKKEAKRHGVEDEVDLFIDEVMN